MIDMIASIHGDVIRLGAYVRCGAAKMKFVTQESKKEGALPRPATVQLGGILQLGRVSRMPGLRLRQVVTAITGYYSTRLFIFWHRRPGPDSPHGRALQFEAANFRKAKSSERA